MEYYVFTSCEICNSIIIYIYYYIHTYSPILTKLVMVSLKTSLTKQLTSLLNRLREFIRHMEREEQQQLMKTHLSPSKLLKKRKWMDNWRSGPPPDWNCKGCSLDAVFAVFFDMFASHGFCWPQKPFGPSK